MTRILVAGAMGRMGGRIAALGLETEGIELAGGFERKGHPDAGRDMGELLGLGRKLGVSLSDDIKAALDLTGADVAIDFTSPASTLENLRACSAAGKAMVIGTTGFKPEELEEIKELSSRVPCVMASNMSLGINLLSKVVAQVAAALGPDYDIEIIEAHHRHKKDAPSGTALMLAKSITSSIGKSLDDVAVYARKGMIGERARGEIGIQTIRAGDIVGEHTVIFGGLGERIEVTHKASSRDTFARGALRAALWLAGRKPGLYDMQDVLGLK
ncbi:MAG: 4-hydroxy-tetrahydrodipicolinate reductase [Nitrospiraceae bacterium]|nr:4-hydroxy-tetrahydrodipicolinate reductase [Nitrospiraceae bacterium]